MILWVEPKMIIFVPFLACFAALLKALKWILACVMGLIGWELVWPPVLIDNPETSRTDEKCGTWPA